MRTMAILMTLVVVAPTVTGCAGAIARREVLIPALQKASVGLEADARRGVATLPRNRQDENIDTVEAFFEIINSSDQARIQLEAIISWGRVQELIELGIDDRAARQEIGPNGAESLRERVRNFDRELRTLVNRTPSF